MTTVALDTNVLVKVFRDEDAAGDALRALLARRAAQGTAFAVPVFCVGELWRIVTDRRAPIRIAPVRALAWIDRLVSSGATLLTPGPRYWATLKALLADALPEGRGVFDCQIAALCQEHGVKEIWTFDRAFVRQTDVEAVDPLTVA
jgi:uncharacterized protein